ncbi:MAG: carbamoyl phosphate synthase small subunit [Clostridia bacterium]|nr:carbamoyl phosphate synthase small subunit [Clostridia bacterium]
MKKVYIVLEDGHVFEGERFGAEGEVIGEFVFTTGMCGYVETLTDPTYYGQIVMHTFPLIGNYGIMEEDFESDKSHLKAYVVREWCEAPSNFRCQYTLDEFLKKQGIVGVCGVDTREITRVIRDNGVMNAKITDDPSNVNFDEIKAYSVTNAVEAVSTKETYTVKAENADKSVTLVDFGKTKSIIAELTKRGCDVTVVPYNTSAEDILKLGADGVVLSNGPADPKDNMAAVEEIKKLIGKVPMLGICLGHQLTALAMGGDTVKLQYGHRGANQPVKSLENGKTYITSQNHGYEVTADSVPCGKQSFVNANDGTCEGMSYADKKVITTQFHPEACISPLNTHYIYDEFITMMGGKN